jgi:hypothetical protein
MGHIAEGMQRYKNLSGNSGVAAYELGSDSITVEFEEGSRYVYTDASAGAENIRQMQQLARRGAGLATFINRVVRERYAQRLH